MNKILITSDSVTGREIINKIHKHFVYSMHKTDLILITHILTARIIESLQNTVIIETNKTTNFIKKEFSKIFNNDIKYI